MLYVVWRGSNTENIRLSATLIIGGSDYQRLQLSATPIISDSDYQLLQLSARFQDPRQTRASVLTLLNIICMCLKIHLSDYRRVQLSADILRPPYPVDNLTFSVVIL